MLELINKIKIWFHERLVKNMQAFDKFDQEKREYK